MNLKHRFLLPLLAMACAMPAVNAQPAAAPLDTARHTGAELAWSVDFATRFDNRESGDAMRPSQTFFFTRLTPEVGVRLHTGTADTHLFKAGAAWNQPVNDCLDGYKVVPSVYYQYTHATSATGYWRAYAGWVPRRHLLERAPRYLWSDSMDYEQPNVRGFVVQRVAGRNHVELMLDWRQLQGQHKREAFNVDLSGRWYPGGGPLWIGGWLQVNHLAKSKSKPEGEGVNDDFTLNPLVGGEWNWAAVGLEAHAGAVINRERDRLHDHKWRTPAGFTAAASLAWRFLSVSEDFYAGKDLFPLYERYGSLLNMGDPYYRDKYYSRTQVDARVVSNRYVELSASLSLHASERTSSFWQQITCRFYLDQDLWRRR